MEAALAGEEHSATRRGEPSAGPSCCARHPASRQLRGSPGRAGGGGHEAGGGGGGRGQARSLQTPSELSKPSAV